MAEEKKYITDDVRVFKDKFLQFVILTVSNFVQLYLSNIEISFLFSALIYEYFAKQHQCQINGMEISNEK